MLKRTGISVLFLLIALISFSALSAEKTVIKSKWMSNSQYIRLFNQMKDNRYFTYYVEGRAHQGLVQYRGVFKPFFPGLKSWYSYHGLTEKEYLKKVAWFIEHNYKALYTTSFVDLGGIQLFQTCWLKVDINKIKKLKENKTQKAI